MGKWDVDRLPDYLVKDTIFNYVLKITEAYLNIYSSILFPLHTSAISAKSVSVKKGGDSKAILIRWKRLLSFKLLHNRVLINFIWERKSQANCSYLTSAGAKKSAQRLLEESKAVVISDIKTEWKTYHQLLVNKPESSMKLQLKDLVLNGNMLKTLLLVVCYECSHCFMARSDESIFWTLSGSKMLIADTISFEAKQLDIFSFRSVLNGCVTSY